MSFSFGTSVRRTLALATGPAPATPHADTDDLQAEVWQDDAGHWVKTRFRGRDGSLIDDACRRWQGPAGGMAGP